MGEIKGNTITLRDLIRSDTYLTIRISPLLPVKKEHISAITFELYRLNYMMTHDNDDSEIETIPNVIGGIVDEDDNVHVLWNKEELFYGLTAHETVRGLMKEYKGVVMPSVDEIQEQVRKFVSSNKA